MKVHRIQTSFEIQPGIFTIFPNIYDGTFPKRVNRQIFLKNVPSLTLDRVLNTPTNE